MTPSLKKLKASKRHTLWYTGENMYFLYDDFNYSFYSNESELWYDCNYYPFNIKKYAHKHWEFIAWL